MVSGHAHPAFDLKISLSIHLCMICLLSVHFANDFASIAEGISQNREQSPTRQSFGDGAPQATRAQGTPPERLRPSREGGSPITIDLPKGERSPLESTPQISQTCPFGTLRASSELGRVHRFHRRRSERSEESGRMPDASAAPQQWNPCKSVSTLILETRIETCLPAGRKDTASNFGFSISGRSDSSFSCRFMGWCGRGKERQLSSWLRHYRKQKRPGEKEISRRRQLR